MQCRAWHGMAPPTFQMGGPPSAKLDLEGLSQSPAEVCLLGTSCQAAAINLMNARGIFVCGSALKGLDETNPPLPSPKTFLPRCSLRECLLPTGCLLVTNISVRPCVDWCWPQPSRLNFLSSGPGLCSSLCP